MYNTERLERYWTSKKVGYLVPLVLFLKKIVSSMEFWDCIISDLCYGSSFWFLCSDEVPCRFSTSVHGERPSGEYARWRKESLESEFGITLGAYSSKSASIFSRFGPFLAFYRAAIISFHVLKLAIWQIFVHDINKRAVTVIFNIEANYTFKFFGYNLQLVNA